MSLIVWINETLNTKKNDLDLDYLKRSSLPIACDMSDGSNRTCTEMTNFSCSNKSSLPQETYACSLSPYSYRTLFEIPIPYGDSLFQMSWVIEFAQMKNSTIG